MSTILLDDLEATEQPIALKSQVARINFPSWKSIVDSTIRSYCDLTLKKTDAMFRVCEDHIALIDTIRQVIQDKIREFHPILAYEITSKTACISSDSPSLEETIAALKKLKLNSNEFYSVFDASVKDQVVVDERIRQILGIKPEQFNMKAMLGFDNDNPLFHPEDLFHSIRFGTIAYMVLSIPNLEFKALEDFFRARFRVGTKASKIPEIKNLEYVTL